METKFHPEAHHLALPNEFPSERKSFHPTEQRRMIVHQRASSSSKFHKAPLSVIAVCVCIHLLEQWQWMERCYSWHILPARWKLQSTKLLIHFGDSFIVIKKDKTDLMVKHSTIEREIFICIRVGGTDDDWETPRDEKQKQTEADDWLIVKVFSFLPVACFRYLQMFESLRLFWMWAKHRNLLKKKLIYNVTEAKLF